MPRGGRGTSGAASLGREPRNRPSRGGIQKRRSAAVFSHDLDVDMDSPSGGRSPNPRGPRRSGLGGKTLQAIYRHIVDGESRPVRPPRDSLSWLRIHGLRQSKASSNTDGGLRGLITFLERKASSGANRSVVIRKSREEGDYVYVAASPAHSVEIQKLDGCAFVGAHLEIVYAPEYQAANRGAPAVSATAKETRAKLQEILARRFDPTLKLLKLNFLSTDEELTRLGLFDTNERAQKTFQAFMVILDDLFKTAKSKRDSVESITVANNGIDNVKQIEALADTFPELKKLELSDNLLPNMSSLQAWKGRFLRLEMLNVAGNPLANDPTHRQVLMGWFPMLQTIDGVQVRTAEQATAAAVARKPRAIPQHGPDFRDANGIGEQFLLDFFLGFDNDRAGLLAKYYDEHSQFSFAVDTNSVRAPDAPPIMPWTAYINFSRNLSKITYPSARVQRLFKGATQIADLWTMLPLTVHPDIKQELPKYIMDCHILPGLVDPSGKSPRGVDGMILTVHGEFDELDPKLNKVGKRGFSRTFILGPGMPGRNPIRVVSDMWTLRAPNSLPNVHGISSGSNSNGSVTTQTQQPLPSIQHDQIHQLHASEQAQRQALIADLARQTGMTAMYTELCLTEVGWDVARGIAVFEEKKNQLPAEAFVMSR